MAASNSSSVCFITPNIGHFKNISDLPDSVLPVWSTLACVNGIAAPFTTVLNALIIWSILGNVQLRAHVYYVLLTALAASDLLVGLVVQPSYCWYFVCLATKCETSCLSTAIAFIVGALCAGLTLCTMMMLSVERYLAVKLPLFHRAHVTRKRVLVIAAAIWVTVPSIMVALRIILNNYETFKTIPMMKVIFGNVIVTLYCTTRVNITAYFKKKALSTLHQTQQQQGEQQNRQIQEYKRAFTMGILVLASIILYLPYVIVNILKTAKVNEDNPEFKYIARPIVNTLILLQSLINPLLMLLRIKKIREIIKNKIICSSNGH